MFPAATARLSDTGGRAQDKEERLKLRRCSVKSLLFLARGLLSAVAFPPFRTVEDKVRAAWVIKEGARGGREQRASNCPGPDPGTRQGPGPGAKWGGNGHPHPDPRSPHTCTVLPETRFSKSILSDDNTTIPTTVWGSGEGLRVQPLGSDPSSGFGCGWEPVSSPVTDLRGWLGINSVLAWKALHLGLAPMPGAITVTEHEEPHRITFLPIPSHRGAGPLCWAGLFSYLSPH